MTNSHFKPSTIGELERMSRVEARFQTLTGLAHRTGYDTGLMPTGRQTLEGYNRWVEETADRPKFLAKPLKVAKDGTGPDYKPVRTSEEHGVNRSSIGTIFRPMARGEPGRVLVPGDTVPLPDPRDQFGHNRDAQVRIPRVRGSVTR